jgi:hypothetical protein
MLAKPRERCSPDGERGIVAVGALCARRPTGLDGAGEFARRPTRLCNA